MIGEIEGKPRCNLAGTNGNTFSVLGRVNRILREAGQVSRARELIERSGDCQSYDEVIILAREYVELE